jgi:large subunit ribosomal protein L21
MIGRLVALGAAVAAAAAGTGAAIWAKRKAEEDAALEREILDIVEDEVMETPVAEPAAEPAPAGDAADGTGADTDELTDIKGIGAISKERLDHMGVTTFAQIAAWSDDDLEAASAIIKISPERIRREDWVGQARARVER